MLVASDATAQARATAARFIRALLDNDPAALRDVFDEQVTRMSANQRIPRDDLVAECLSYARQLELARDQRAEDAANLRDARMRSLASEPAPLPVDLLGTDVLVQLTIRGARNPVLNPNQTSLPCLTPFVVRPRADSADRCGRALS